MSKMVTVKLTPAQAKHVWLNADGWLDAGSCEGGLRLAEKRALNSLCDQIMAQTTGKKSAPAAFAEALREQVLDSLCQAGFAWYSDDERKIMDAIMRVIADEPTPTTGDHHD